MSRTLKIVLGVVVAAVVLVVGGTYVYINVISDDAPPPLSLDSGSSTTAAGGTATTAAGGATTTDPYSLGTGSSSSSGGTFSLDGSWKVGTDSIAGYRVKEILFGQSKEAAGRTSKVSGTFTAAGTKVTAADITVDMASMASDSSNRDGQFNGRIMETSKFPTATFKLISPIDLGSVPASGTKATASAVGDLTMHGVTKKVTIPLQVQQDGTTVSVLGSTTITFADYSINNPSGGPASVGNDGTMEFLLKLTKG